ncbi:MAG: hypothetical protein LBI49_25690, partial [Nocardiopsaceae bacterium]|nr:hypothetical protein [Nocardiopsaceae bacterium]
MMRQRGEELGHLIERAQPQRGADEEHGEHVASRARRSGGEPVAANSGHRHRHHPQRTTLGTAERRAAWSAQPGRP